MENNLQSWYDDQRIVLVMCIFLAAIFWTFVQMSQEYASSCVFETNYELPQGFLFKKEPPPQLTVDVRGSGWDLLRIALRRGDFQLNLPIEAAREQRISSVAIREQIRRQLKNNVQILEGSVPTILLEMEPAELKTLPIVAAYDISLEPGLSLRNTPTCRPDSVKVSGPQSAVAALTAIYTDSIYLSELRTPKSVAVPLVTPQEEIRLVKDSTVVTFPVERRVEKSFYRPVIINNATTDSLQIFPNRVKVNAIVYLSDFDAVGPESFSVTAQYTKDNNNSTTLPLTLEVNTPHVVHADMTPQQVNYLIIAANGDSLR